MTANGHVNDNAPFYQYAMPSRLYESRPDGRFVDISHQSGSPLGVAARRPRPGRRRPRQRRPCRRLDRRSGSAPGLFPQPDAPGRPLRDAPARGHDIQPRRRGSPGHRHGRRSAASRAAPRRRSYLSATIPGSTSDSARRPRRVGRSPLAVGQDRPLAVPPRRVRVLLARRRSDAPTPGGICSPTRCLNDAQHWELSPNATAGATGV